MIAGVHITKQADWRGNPEQFENVYHFDTPSITTDAGWDELIDAVVAIEKPLFASMVSWIQARVHGPTNTTKAEDVMIRVKDLTGSGTLPGSGALTPLEMAIVASVYLGRSPRGFKVFLRKYWHTGRLASSPTGSSAALGNAALLAGDKTPYVNAFNSMRQITIGPGNNTLCTPSGRPFPAGATVNVANHLHVRQFRH